MIVSKLSIKTGVFRQTGSHVAFHDILLEISLENPVPNFAIVGVGR